MLINLLNLFVSFFKVGLLSFGGAYSLIPIIEAEVVKNNQWLGQDEFLKILSISQFVPGAISIKFATYAGYKVAGIPGALVANLGNMMIPAVIIIGAYYSITYFEKNEVFNRIFDGIKYAIVGMIIVIMFQYMFKGSFNLKTLSFVIIGVVLTLLKVHPAYIVVLAGFLAFLL